MSCACGHHHPGQPHPDHGVPAPLAQPLIALQGRLICNDTAQMMTALSLLPDHVALSRAEPGNLRFDLHQDEDPLIWTLLELFTDAAAFAAHQARTADSDWGRSSTDITRDFQRSEVMPVIRPEAPGDAEAISALLRAAFGGDDEARLVQALRRDGDLHTSLVAVAQGVVLGHVALSPLAGDRPALALAPVAVHPALQGRGLGGFLIDHALARVGDQSVVVLGDPGYYTRFGFRAADLASPYAGPHLMMIGDLPPGTEIRHAPAFASL